MNVLTPEDKADYTRYHRSITRRAFTGSVVVGLILFVLGLDTLARGLVLGSLFSVINFALMAHFLPKQISPSSKRSSMFAFFSLFIRLGLLAVPMAVALRSDSFHWAAVAVGLFIVPMAIFLEQFITNWVVSRVVQR